MLCRLSGFSLLILCGILAHSPVALARVIHVSNVDGSDAMDGSAARPVNVVSGPLASLQRAVQIARPGDVIEVAKTPEPYYGSITLQGTWNSGTPLQPFIIRGNGAELSGAVAVPTAAWQNVGTDLYATVPRKKGYYMLLSAGKALQEVRTKPTDTDIPALQPGEWCVLGGRVTVRIKPGQLVSDLDLALAWHEVGITLYKVNNVVISNLTVKHFQTDGINAHDLCENLILDQVTAVENGRAGVVVAGSSLMKIIESTIRDNRWYSVLITERGGLDVDNLKTIVPAPTVQQPPEKDATQPPAN